MVRLLVAMRDALLVVMNGAAGWRAERVLPGSSPQCLAADPRRPSRVYCGTWAHGLWWSDDAGASWTDTHTEPRQARITALAVSASERDGDFGVVYAGTEPSAMCRSDDGGRTWQPTRPLVELPSAPTWSFPPRPWTHHVRAIAADPHVAGRVFVGIEAGALVRTDDGGASWHDRAPGSPVDVHELRMHPLAPGRVYAAAGDGLWQPGEEFAESHDGGVHWSHPDVGLSHPYAWSLALDPANPDTMVISCADGPREAHDARAAASYVYRSAADAGWMPAQQGLPAAEGTLASVLASHAAEPGVFYAASNRGLFRSTDTGRWWERIQIPWPDGAGARPRAIVATE